MEVVDLNFLLTASLRDGNSDSFFSTGSIISNGNCARTIFISGNYSVITTVTIIGWIDIIETFAEIQIALFHFLYLSFVAIKCN